MTIMSTDNIRLAMVSIMSLSKGSFFFFPGRSYTNRRYHMRLITKEYLDTKIENVNLKTILRKKLEVLTHKKIQTAHITTTFAVSTHTTIT